jgi:hypothetical protein
VKIAAHSRINFSLHQEATISGKETAKVVAYFSFSEKGNSGP